MPSRDDAQIRFGDMIRTKGGKEYLATECHRGGEWLRAFDPKAERDEPKTIRIVEIAAVEHRKTPVPIFFKNPMEIVAVTQIFGPFARTEKVGGERLARIVVANDDVEVAKVVTTILTWASENGVPMTGMYLSDRILSEFGLTLQDVEDWSKGKKGRISA